MRVRKPIVVPARWFYTGLALCVAAIWLATLGSRPLFNPDEGRYAEIPREMLAGGDWVIPHLNGVAYLEKPPLQYWATALSLRMFGAGEFGARFYTAWCALCTLLVIGFVGLELWGLAAGWRAAAVLSSFLLFVVLGQLLTLDMSLTLYTTLSLGGFLLAQPRPHSDKAARAGVRERRYMLLAWAAAGLGVLTKGLEAAVIPAAVLVSYSLLSRDWSPWRRLQLPWGLSLFLVITVPWHWLAARRLPDFLQFFFVHEHVARYLTPSADRQEPWWFFAVVLALGTLPWTASVLRVLGGGWRRQGAIGGDAHARAAHGPFDATQFLWVWVLFVCVFFSLSDSKLIPYILPALPALALLIGELKVAALRRDVTITALLSLTVTAGLIAAAAVAPRYLAPTGRNAYFLLLAAPLWKIAALLAVSAVFALLQRVPDVTRAAIFLSIGWCLAGLMVMRAAGAVAPVYSGIVLARALEQGARDAPMFSVATYDQGLPFYWRRTLTVVAYRGELDFGLRHDEQAAMRTVPEFVTRWQDLSKGYAVMEIDLFDRLTTRGVPLREVARDVHRVLASRR